MAESETKAAEKWWPKLVLWGAVVFVGILYLGSIYMHRADGVPDGVGMPTADSVPADDMAQSESGGDIGEQQEVPSTLASPEPLRPPERAGGTGLVESQSAELPAGGQNPIPAGLQSAPPGPVQEVRAGNQAPVAPGSRGFGWPFAMPGEQIAPVSASGEEPSPAPQQAQETPVAGSEATADTVSQDRAGEGEAFAKAINSEGDAGSSGQPVESETPTQPDQVDPALPAPNASTAVSQPRPESAADRRARVMADYEARRKAAEEQMRQFWERSRMQPGGGAGPYGAYPGYAPGYYPQR